MMVIYTCPECGGDLMPYVITTYPPISACMCLKCGWRWESEREELRRIPFVPVDKEDGDEEAGE